MKELALVGRSSSHFTRTARVFAHELGIEVTLRPVFDLSSVTSADYAHNPALKIPVLVDERGALFGAENVCRELVRRSGKGAQVVMRGDVGERVVANAEELTLHVMSSEVTLIMAKASGDARLAPPKVARSIEESLAWLDAHVEAAVAALPPTRLVSFLEVSLYCLVTHLPWREVMDVSRFAGLEGFVQRFGERASARATEYRFDQA